MIAIFACCFIAWHWVDFQGFSITNLLKALFLSLPILLWLSLWSLIKELTQLPDNLTEIKQVGEESLALVAGIQEKETSKKSLFGSLFRLIQTIRDPEIFTTILSCVKGLTLLTNPLSFIALILSVILIVIFILTAIGLAIF